MRTKHSNGDDNRRPIIHGDDHWLACQIAILKIEENDDFDLDEISQVLSLQPSRKWDVKTLSKNGFQLYQVNAWIVDSVIESVDLGEHIDNLLSIFSTLSESALEFLQTCDVELNICSSRLKQDGPVHHFTFAQLAGLARLNARLDIDVVLTGDMFIDHD